VETRALITRTGRILVTTSSQGKATSKANSTFHSIVNLAFIRENALILEKQKKGYSQFHISLFCKLQSLSSLILEKKKIIPDLQRTRKQSHFSHNCKTLSSAVEWWDEWRLRITARGSLFVQWLLFFLAPMHKLAISSRLRSLIWAYGSRT
jgi:hypothetical protein